MIGIIDYGLGNIQAFANIYQKLNIEHCFVKTKEQLEGVSKIILPGVGAFDYAMDSLNRSGMRETLDKMVLENKTPVLGICVGMQIMASSSEEGVGKGLSWIDGVVRKIPVNSHEYPLPHMGWNNVIQKNNNPIFQNIEDLSNYYFLHSFYFDCASSENVIGEVDYGIRFAALIQKNHIFGIQCHPEKSHEVGTRTLENFARLNLC